MRPLLSACPAGGPGVRSAIGSASAVCVSAIIESYTEGDGSQPEADQLQASSAPQRLLPVMSAREFTVLATQRLCMRLWHLGPSGWFQSDAETGASTTTARLLTSANSA